MLSSEVLSISADASIALDHHTERHLILSRTAEGRQRAKARGVRFGRKPKLTTHQQAEARARLEQGETLVEIARSYNVSHMTISRLASAVTQLHVSA